MQFYFCHWSALYVFLSLYRSTLYALLFLLLVHSVCTFIYVIGPLYMHFYLYYWSALYVLLFPLLVCSVCTFISVIGPLCMYFYLCYWSTLYELLSLVLIRSVCTFIWGWMLNYSLLNFAKLKKNDKILENENSKREDESGLFNRPYPSYDTLPQIETSSLMKHLPK